MAATRSSASAEVPGPAAIAIQSSASAEVPVVKSNAAASRPLTSAAVRSSQVAAAATRGLGSTVRSGLSTSWARGGTLFPPS